MLAQEVQVLRRERSAAPRSAETLGAPRLACEAVGSPLLQPDAHAAQLASRGPHGLALLRAPVEPDLERAGFTVCPGPDQEVLLAVVPDHEVRAAGGPRGDEGFEAAVRVGQGRGGALGPLVDRQPREERGAVERRRRLREPVAVVHRGPLRVAGGRLLGSRRRRRGRQRQPFGEGEQGDALPGGHELPVQGTGREEQVVEPRGVVVGAGRAVGGVVGHGTIGE